MSSGAPIARRGDGSFDDDFYHLDGLKVLHFSRYDLGCVCRNTADFAKFFPPLGEFVCEFYFHALLKCLVVASKVI